MNLSQLVVYGFASASLWQLFSTDRITQAVRYGLINQLRKLSKKRILKIFVYHIEYVLGCSLCFPMWAATALYLGRHTHWVQIVTYILAIRFAAFISLVYFGLTTNIDWPEPHKWPPTKIKRGKK